MLVGSIALALTAGLLMWLVVQYASRKPDEVNLPGGDTFVVGNAERFAKRIADQREPILFKDPLSSRAGREIYVLHEGRDAEEGWSAVLAYAERNPRRVECVLRWDRQASEFVDPCTDETYRPDDDRLVRYPADVNDAGNVEVDLRRAALND